MNTNLLVYLPGEILDVQTQGTTNALVTLQCPRGKVTYLFSSYIISYVGESHKLPSEYNCSGVGVNGWTIYNLVSSVV